MYISFRRLPFIICLLCLSCGTALAQETRGSITGRVADATESLIPGARVEALNTATGTVAASVTNQAGSYDIPYLLPGAYRVSCRLPDSRPPYGMRSKSASMTG